MDQPNSIIEPSQEHPGWLRWKRAGASTFYGLYGDLFLRDEEQGKARVRWYPADHHKNMLGTIHGGALLGFIDICLFGALRAKGVINVSGSVTVDLSTQFLKAGRLDKPVEALVEILNETGRLIFLRGLLQQDDDSILSFQATVRKASPQS